MSHEGAEWKAATNSKQSIGSDPLSNPRTSLNKDKKKKYDAKTFSGMSHEGAEWSLRNKKKLQRTASNPLGANPSATQ